jgi:hypothetical protein
LLTGGLKRWLFSSIQLCRLTGGWTAGWAGSDDLGLEAVEVAMWDVISVRSQRQTPDKGKRPTRLCKASARQALTCLAVASAKAEHPMIEAAAPQHLASPAPPSLKLRRAKGAADPSSDIRPLAGPFTIAL